MGNVGLKIRSVGHILEKTLIVFWRSDFRSADTHEAWSEFLPR